MDNEQQLYHQTSAFVQFLSSWSSNESTLDRRIKQLARDIARNQFWQWKEVEIIDAWIDDLHSVGYKFPKIIQQKSISQTNKIKRRTAVCVTGLAECIQEGWTLTYNNLRNRLQGDIDTFLFLSSTSSSKQSVPSSTRFKQIRSYMNSTVTILYEDRVIDPNIPLDCKPEFQLRNHVTFSVPAYFQQLWSLNQCYDLVKDYEKRYNIEYQIMVRSRIDILPKMPSTFERSDKFNINTTILVPPNRYFPSIDDGFAIGPINLMKHYMTRWLSLRECPSDRNFHPETYLNNYLKRFTTVTVDSNISGAADAIPHGRTNCH